MRLLLLGQSDWGGYGVAFEVVRLSIKYRCQV
jgi:hypothetical protein